MARGRETFRAMVERNPLRETFRAMVERNSLRETFRAMVGRNPLGQSNLDGLQELFFIYLVTNTGVEKIFDSIQIHNLRI